MPRRALVLLCLLLCLLLRPAGVEAAQPVAPPAPALPDQTALQSLARTLRDPASRDALLEQIDGLIAVQQANRKPTPPKPASTWGPAATPGPAATWGPAATPVPAATWGQAEVARLGGVAGQIGAGVIALGRLGILETVRGWMVGIITDPATRTVWLHGLAVVPGVLTVALAGALLVARGVAAARRQIHAGSPSAHLLVRVLRVLGAIALGMLPVAAWLACGYAALSVAGAWRGAPAPAVALALAVVDAAALVGVFRAIVGALLLPAADGRILLPRVTPSLAAYWYRWLTWLARLGIYGWFTIAYANQEGVSDQAAAGLAKGFGLVLLVLLAVLIVQNRAAVARVIQGGADAERADTAAAASSRRHAFWLRLRLRLARTWHIFALLYLVGLYAVWAADIPGGPGFLARASLLSVVILGVARLLDQVGTRIAHRFMQVGPVAERRLPGLQRRVMLYAPALTGTGRIAIYSLAVLLVLQAWQVRAMDVLATRPGRYAVGSFVTVAIAAGVAVIAWEAVMLLTELYFSRPGTTAARSARVRTLLPLFRRTLAIVLGIAVILVALAAIGLNIGPLLAGAGIAGVAVGFGAQTLVKDIITGALVLAQDMVSVGDIATCGGASGLVEDISIRTISLRGSDGSLAIVPWSNVTTVTNLTKDYAYALFNVGVGYREDADHVMDLLRELGAEMQADAEMGPKIMAPIEIWGLDHFADSSVVIIARIKTLPIQQWNVMREFNRRMKKRFDAENIEMPYPSRTVWFGEDRQGGAPPMRLRPERRQH